MTTLLLAEHDNKTLKDATHKALTRAGPAYGHLWAEPMAALVLSLAPGYDAIVAAATTTGKNVMPRIAALLDVMQVSDIVKVIAPDTFERLIYAGNAIQTVRSKDKIKIITGRTSTVQATGEGGSAPIEEVAAVADPGISTFVGEELSKSERPELTSAKIIIRSEEHTSELQSLAYLVCRLLLE